MRYAYEMTYINPAEERSTVSLEPYSPKYQEQYKLMYNACYHEMREALGIKPYDFIRDDSFFEQGMDKVYLLVEDDELIGSVALKGEEIDDLLVDKKHQGKGYGKQILLWAIENINTGKIILHVAKWNEKATALYEKTGFEITKVFEI